MPRMYKPLMGFGRHNHAAQEAEDSKICDCPGCTECSHQPPQNSLACYKSVPNRGDLCDRCQGEQNSGLLQQGRIVHKSLRSARQRILPGNS